MNEIAHGADSTKTLYFHVYNFADKTIRNTTNGLYEVVGTWNDARAVETANVMTAAGDAHFGDFPASARGVYFVLIKNRATGAVLASDKEVGQGVEYWDGAKEVNVLTEIESWQKNG